MKSIYFVRLLVILADVRGSILQGVVCYCLLLRFNICPFSLLTVLYTNVRHFFLSFTNWFKSFTLSPVTLLMSSIHRIRGFPFFLAPALIPSIISLSKDWCARITCPNYRIFCILIMASNERLGHTLCKISLLLSTTPPIKLKFFLNQIC